MYDLSGLDSGYYQKSGMGDNFVTEQWSKFKNASMLNKALIVGVIIAVIVVILVLAGLLSVPGWSKERLTTPSHFIGRGGMERDDYGSPDISRTEAVRVVPGADCGKGICSIDDEYCRMYNANLATPGSDPSGENFSGDYSGGYPAMREAFEVNNDLAMIQAMRGE